MHRHQIIQRRVRSVRLGDFRLRSEKGYGKNGEAVVPQELSDFVPKGRSFSYDTIWKVTQMRYLEHMQREEIQRALPFSISTGSISNLYTDGLAYFRTCQEKKQSQLRDYYVNEKRPFILQLDGTNEGGGCCLFQIRDSYSGNVLLARKIPTENTVDIKKMLEEIETMYAKPQAVICDMSSKIITAVNGIWEHSVPIYLCQFHFLRDIGKDLLNSSYEKLRKELTSSATSRELNRTRRRIINHAINGDTEHKRYYYQQTLHMLDWVRDFKNELNAMGFPFDLAWKSYYERCCVMSEQISKIRRMPGNIPSIGYKALDLLNRRLSRAVDNGSLKRAYNELEKDWCVFENIRSIFPSYNTNNTAPLSGNSKSTDTDSIDTKELNKRIDKVILDLNKLDEEQKGKSKGRKKNRYAKAIEQLQKYSHQLGTEIDFNGKTFKLPTTNNLCEISFRDLKRDSRRRTGKKNLTRQIDNTPAEIIYLQNLRDPDYCQIVYGNESIESAFSQIPLERIKEIRESMRTTHTNRVNLKIIRSPDFLKEFSERLKQKVS